MFHYFLLKITLLIEYCSFELHQIASHPSPIVRWHYWTVLLMLQIYAQVQRNHLCTVITQLYRLIFRYNSKLVSQRDCQSLSECFWKNCVHTSLAIHGFDVPVVSHVLPKVLIYVIQGEIVEVTLDLHVVTPFWTVLTPNIWLPPTKTHDLSCRAVVEWYKTVFFIGSFNNFNKLGYF